MSQYAKNTSVSESRSRDEIERILTRYGATGFMYAWQDSDAIIEFVYGQRHIRFLLRLPILENYQRTPTGRKRTANQATEEHKKAIRQCWRALVLGVKAKLEFVESGIATFEDEFLAHTVLPNGSTVGQEIAPRLAEIEMQGDMRPLLPMTALSSG